ncbi:MAG: T9SS type A sorting domain-containing protein [Saprospiraceae bacterium]
MNILKNILVIGLLLFTFNWGNAQVKFKLTMLEDGQTYQVSLIPEVTFQNPLNLTSTGQVTLKAPTNGLAIEELLNLQEAVVWEQNSLTESPAESPNHDYISFGLVTQGTKDIKYDSGVEVPLFAFKNTLECQGEITLIDNLTDAFAPPNSTNVNVGNQLTILGAQGDAYVGNSLENKVPCGANLTAIENIELNKINLILFPNPAVDNLKATFDWDRKEENAQLTVLNMDGKVVISQVVTIQSGNNITKIDVQKLAQGNYFLEVTGADWKINSEQFVKMAH